MAHPLDRAQGNVVAKSQCASQVNLLLSFSSCAKELPLPGLQRGKEKWLLESIYALCLSAGRETHRSDAPLSSPSLTR